MDCLQFKGVWDWKPLRSENASYYLQSQKPLAIMSTWALSSILEDMCCNFSLVRVWFSANTGTYFRENLWEYVSNLIVSNRWEGHHTGSSVHVHIEFISNTHCEWSKGGLQPYHKQIASQNPLLWRANPCLARGSAVNQIAVPPRWQHP